MTELFAWVNPTATGEDSIVGVMLPGLGHIPLVNARSHFLASDAVRQLVRDHVQQHGYAARLIRFEQSEIVEEVPFAP